MTLGTAVLSKVLHTRRGLRGYKPPPPIIGFFSLSQGPLGFREQRIALDASRASSTTILGANSGGGFWHEKFVDNPLLADSSMVYYKFGKKLSLCQSSGF